MKNLIALLFVIALSVACNKKTSTDDAQVAEPAIETTDTTAVPAENAPTQADAAVYACPMHAEVTGKKSDKCSKCGMELTEPVG